MKTDSKNPVIHFYKVADPFGEFSNFSKHPIEISGKIWPSTEHYFQAMKFESQEHQSKIQHAKTAIKAAQLGRQRQVPIRADWDEIRVDVMRCALIAKFSQHLDLRDLLLNTENATLVEHTSNDSFWGDGGDGSGENMLGRLLMEVRTSLRDSS